MRESMLFMGLLLLACTGGNATDTPDAGSAVSAIRLSGEWDRTCFIDARGALFCWGAADGATPVRVVEGTWREVAATVGFTCAIRSEGTLWCWGQNLVGDGTTLPRRLPIPVGTTQDWAHVATGPGHSCAIRNDGTLWCWFGDEWTGWVPSPDFQITPIQVGVERDWVQVSNHFYRTCGVRAQGTLWCWEADDSGIMKAPVQVGTDQDWMRIAVGALHQCAVRRDGTLWCWGVNASGELGLGTATEKVSAPAQVGTADWNGVAIGYHHTCALREDGGLWCWGQGRSGEIDGVHSSDKTNPIPVPLGEPAGWSAVTAGVGHSCVARGQDEVWCWGQNTSGELGLGTIDEVVHPPTLLFFDE